MCAITAKKVAFTRLENYRLTSQNAAFCLHSLVFSDCKILGFPFVFLTVNSSFHSIIRQFSTRWTAGKQAMLLVFTAWLTPWKQIVFRCFPGVFRSQNRVLTGVYKSFLSFTARLTPVYRLFSNVFWCFPVTKQRIRWSFQWLFLYFLNSECTQNARKPPVLQRSPCG